MLVVRVVVARVLVVVSVVGWSWLNSVPSLPWPPPLSASPASSSTKHVDSRRTDSVSRGGPNLVADVDGGPDGAKTASSAPAATSAASTMSPLAPIRPSKASVLITGEWVPITQNFRTCDEEIA